MMWGLHTLSPAALVLLVALGTVAGLESQGYMYLEHAKLNPFDVLYNIQYYDPIPIPVRKKIEDTEKLWTSERKKEAVKIVPQGISYMKRNTLTPDELAAGLKEMMSRLKREEKSKRKGKGNRNEKIKVRANPFEQAFASQFYLGEDGFASLSWDRSTQIQGDFRGGLISIAQVQWEYGARDVSQSTEQLMYNNKRSKRDYSSSTIGVNKDGLYPPPPHPHPPKSTCLQSLSLTQSIWLLML